MPGVEYVGATSGLDPGSFGANRKSTPDARRRRSGSESYRKQLSYFKPEVVRKGFGYLAAGEKAASGERGGFEKFFGSLFSVEAQCLK